jgi:uncharacterized membrane protein YraQ (UPF0718 family)
MTAWLKSELLLVFVAALYAWAFIASPDRAVTAVMKSATTFLGVLPIIAAVFAALGLFGVWVDKKKIAGRLGEGSGFGTLVIASVFGTVLVGPVYVIFPLLKAVREHGARWSIIGAVLTAWAVKIPMIPLEIGFLGVRFSLARSVLVILTAIPLGLLLEYLMKLGSDSSQDQAIHTR